MGGEGHRPLVGHHYLVPVLGVAGVSPFVAQVSVLSGAALYLVGALPGVVRLRVVDILGRREHVGSLEGAALSALVGGLPEDLHLVEACGHILDAELVGAVGHVEQLLVLDSIERDARDAHVAQCLGSQLHLAVLRGFDEIRHLGLGIFVAARSVIVERVDLRRSALPVLRHDPQGCHEQ